jgi:hypothetical protein
MVGFSWADREMPRARRMSKGFMGFGAVRMDS